MALPLSLPISASLAITYLINTLLAFAAVVLADRIIAHEMEAKRALVIAVISLFATPLLAPYLGIYDRGVAILLSLVVWVVMGEILFHADFQTKLKVMGVAFLVYYILSIFLLETIQGYLRPFMQF